MVYIMGLVYVCTIFCVVGMSKVGAKADSDSEISFTQLCSPPQI
jgi:hypothetical protein